MKKQKFNIAGGNPTLLIWGSSPSTKKLLSQKYLKEADQVGFAKQTDKPSLEMMGNELCINATLAFASTLGKSGLLKASGFVSTVRFINSRERTYLKIKIPYTKENNIILFPGIGFIYSENTACRSKSTLSSLARKYSLPAFGSLQYYENKIDPLVFVKETDSLVRESACGSGSIACAIMTGLSEIIHPTGQSILVRQRGDTFIVGAKVDKIG